MSTIKDFGKRAGRVLMIGTQISTALLVLPFILYGLYSVGIGGPWLAGGVMIVFAVAAIKTFPVPFMRVPVVAKSMVAGALIALIFILIDMNVQVKKQQELANLKIFSPSAYVDELKALGRDDEWFAALKDIRPEEYATEKARRDERTQREQARRAEQARRDRIKRLYEDAKDDGRHGINLRATEFGDIWNLSVSEGRLHCKHGPVFDGQPRPYVLFDAGGKTYGVNGAAMGKGGYGDARTLLAGEAGQPPYDLKMLNILIKAGQDMCRATLDEACGTDYVAIHYAEAYMKSRLKSPSTADFSSDGLAEMVECGRWAVASSVDAQNTFGAMIRTHFTASVVRSPNGQWKVRDFSVSP